MRNVESLLLSPDHAAFDSGSRIVNAGKSGSQERVEPTSSPFQLHVKCINGLDTPSSQSVPGIQAMWEVFREIHKLSISKLGGVGWHEGQSMAIVER